MADRRRLIAHPALRPWHRHWVLAVLAVFAASRVVSTAILLLYARAQPANGWTDAAPGYFEFANLWDGHWYERIADSGYPERLPRSEDGHVTENAWAFMPVYPLVVRALMLLTGFEWPVAAVTVSVLAGAGAALVFFVLMRQVLGDPGRALFAVALLCFGVVSPLFQVAYAESLHLLLLFTALVLVVRRRYLVLLPIVVLMAFTRPTGLPFALFLALHVAYRWWRRRQERFDRGEVAASVLATVVSGACALAWPAIAWAVTGSLTAYTDTELAWRAPYIGWQPLVPFTAWVQGANWWLGEPLGVIVLAVVLLAFVGVMVSPWVRRLGTDLRLWMASYVLYLLAVFFPQSSTMRLLLPAVPLVGALAIPRSRVWRIALLTLVTVAQVGWVHLVWWIDGADWTPP